MRRILLTISLVLLQFLWITPAFALENPLSTPNNKFGIHILFDTELPKAATLVNSSGGDWGYVLIPIQAGDKDLVKWQHFMDEAADKHLIPIIRLATEGDYFNTQVWRKPEETDIIDFANFLNSLTWPTTNHYIVVFNEVNRGDEWGGSADPTDYAQLLSYAVSVFKSINPDFFVISAGLDNAAPNQGSTYINEYTFMREMNDAVPGIFNQVDGIASHSYPNPGFAQPPSNTSSESISSFKTERAEISTMTSKKLPIFITETGWSSASVSPTTQASYYKQALESVWNDPDIVAITPFILQASGPFGQFSFLDQNGNPTPEYLAFRDIPKIKGTPRLSKKVLAASAVSVPLVTKSFPPDNEKKPVMTLSQELQATFKWMMKI